MDCEKDVLRIQKKLDKIVKEELVIQFFYLVRDTLLKLSVYLDFRRAKMRHWII